MHISFLKGIGQFFLALFILTIVTNEISATCLDKPTINEKLECLDRQISYLNSVPQKAIVAFDSQTCPSGWKIYSQAKGRTIIGSGQGNGLTQRYLHQSGGEEKHTLTKSELPAHSHRVSTGKADTRTGGKKLPYVGAAHGPWYTSDEGGSQAHNNMPPFVVLTICEKE